MTDRDSDGDIRIKFDDDGSWSSYIKTSQVIVIERSQRILGDETLRSLVRVRCRTSRASRT